MTQFLRDQARDSEEVEKSARNENGKYFLLFRLLFLFLFNFCRFISAAGAKRGK